MTELVIAVAAGCLLGPVETVGGITTIEVEAVAPGCAWIDVVLPPGTRDIWLATMFGTSITYNFFGTDTTMIVVQCCLNKTYSLQQRF